MSERFEVICGVWMDARVKVYGVIHRGAFTPHFGCLGEVQAACGERDLGYITLDPVTCPDCATPAPED